MLRTLLAATAVLLVALPARAERSHDTVTLTYLPNRAVVALCPGADYLENEVFVRLRYALFQPDAPKHLTVKVDRKNGEFLAAGELRDDEGNILFAGTYPAVDCTFAVFSIAVALSAHYAELPEAPPPIPPAPPLPPPEPDPEPEEPPAPPVEAPPVPSPRRFEAGLTSVFAIGTAPSVLGGVGWFVGVRWPSVSLALEGRALFAPSATVDRATVRDGHRFEFIAASSTGCYHHAWGFGCARVEVGSLHIGSDGIESSSSRVSVLGVGFRLGGDWPLYRWLAVRAYADVSLQPLSRIIQDTPVNITIWRQPLLSGSIGLGPVFTIPGI